MLVLSCKYSVSDEDLKLKVENLLTSLPTVKVDVKDGVVILSGTVKSDDEREAVENSAHAVDNDNIKSVVNNLIIEAPVVVDSISDNDLLERVQKITKNFPKVDVSVNVGVVSLKGEVEKVRLSVLKEALDTVSAQKIDLDFLEIK